MICMTMNVKVLLGSLFLYTIIISPVSTAAQESSSHSVGDVPEQLFDKMQVAQKLMETTEELHSQFVQNPFGLPDAQNEQMMDLFLEAFSKPMLVNDAKEIFQQNLNSQYADSTLQWIQQPNTKTVLEAQKQYYTLQGIRQRIVHKYELEQQPPSDERTEIIQSLAENTSAIESEIESKVIIFRAIVSAFDEFNTQQSFSEMQLNGIVNNFRSQLQSQVEQEVNDRFLLMYYEIENDNLSAYSSFYNTESGRWLNSTISKSIHAAYQSAADRFLKSVRNL